MNSENEKIIKLSRIKLLMAFLGACAVVAFGVWLFFMDSAANEQHRRSNSPVVTHCIGLLIIIFGGSCGVAGFKKLFDGMPGLILSSVGIFDNSSVLSVGIIPWSDIVGFDVFTVSSQKNLVIKVLNPEKYIRGSGIMKRILLKSNYMLCESPITISSASLKITFKELVDTCNRYYSKYGRRAGLTGSSAVSLGKISIIHENKQKKRSHYRVFV